MVGKNKNSFQNRSMGDVGVKNGCKWQGFKKPMAGYLMFFIAKLGFIFGTENLNPTLCQNMM
jgi:hypothetical protein